MYRNENQVISAKYDREIKARVDAEVRFMEKSRWVDALEEDLAKLRRMRGHLERMLEDESANKEELVVELNALRTRVRMLEAQALTDRQILFESSHHRQKHEQQMTQNRASMDRAAIRVSELKEQLDAEIENAKKLAEREADKDRELRKLQTKNDDECLRRQQVQNERDALRERLEMMDKEMAALLEERRHMQKQVADVNLKNMKVQVDLRRDGESLKKAEEALSKLGAEHSQLRAEHGALVTDADFLRADLKNLQEQVHNESEARKQLQQDNRQMTGHLACMTVDRDTATACLTVARNELAEATEKFVKLERLLRETKSALTKVQLEHQVESKANAQKNTMFENIIADERAQRRALVAETEEQTMRREEAMEALRRKDLECQDVKRQRFEKEEDVDRLKLKLKAQEQVSGEHLMIVDRYHATVSNHEAEMRQMQVLLEAEREETKRVMTQMRQSFLTSKAALERRIEGWQMSYEDVVSSLNFNPATQKLKAAEKDIKALREEIAALDRELADGASQAEQQELLLGEKARKICDLDVELRTCSDNWASLLESNVRCMLDLERQGVARADAEQFAEHALQIKDGFGSELERSQQYVADAHAEIERLTMIIHRPTADASTQAHISMYTNMSQTDLSYQYLDCSDRLHTDFGRHEKLDKLKRASHFVEDAEAARDFTVGARSAIQGQELRLEPQSDGRGIGGGVKTVIESSLSAHQHALQSTQPSQQQAQRRRPPSLSSLVRDGGNSARTSDPWPRK
mmetsp:Transcript_2656/g.7933  ORF Transcript_2656/g.7933 Transcript_2656/m.7933 type:complete len:754 (-) Transcript_2656:291-2552(-)